MTSPSHPADPASVRELFETIAPRYDLLNDLLSLGLHRVWKRQAAAWLRPGPGQHLLDLCCGTGDLALVLASRVRPGGMVVGLDTAEAPLAIARRRSERLPWLPIRWCQGDALATGLDSASLDGVVMAYGLRNLPDPAAALQELRRLVRPGGRVAVLDFNRPDDESMEHLQRAYLRRVVVPAARCFHVADSYAYIETSLGRFPRAPWQEALARAAGFSSAHHRPLAGGLMGLLELVA